MQLQKLRTAKDVSLCWSWDHRVAQRPCGSQLVLQVSFTTVDDLDY